jgi:hypothetical protein
MWMAITMDRGAARQTSLTGRTGDSHSLPINAPVNRGDIRKSCFFDLKLIAGLAVELNLFGQQFLSDRIEMVWMQMRNKSHFSTC